MESKKKCVFGCDSLGAYMHRFPHPQKYSEMFIIWLSSVGDKMQEKDHMKIYNTKRVCDYHFESGVKVSGHRLLKSAVPTMYLQGVKKSNNIKVQLEHNYCLPRMLNTNTVPMPSTSQLLHESVKITMSDHEVTIRAAQKEDMEAVAAMIQELADFEKMPDGPKINAKVLQKDGFETTPPAFRCLIAEYSGDQNSIVGYALYFPTYSTWEGLSMMLEDLYVKPSERRRGIGENLFNAVAREATSSGCSRLDFHVLEWNDARAFYEGKGAVNLTSKEQWCYYRLTGDALQNAANHGYIHK